MRTAEIEVNGILYSTTRTGRSNIVNLVDVDSTPAGNEVTFVINGRTIEFEEDDFTDQNWVSARNNVEINGDNVDGFLRVKAQYLSPSVLEIQSIEWRMLIENDANAVFLDEGDVLSSEIRRPNSMLNEKFDIFYGGLDIPGTSTFAIDALGDDKYRAGFTNVEGIDYRFDLVDNSANFKLGDATNNLWFVEPTNCNFVIEQGDEMILTRESTPIENSITRIFQYDSIDPFNMELSFTDTGVGGVQVIYQPNSTACPGATGEGIIVAGGNVFDFIVGPAPSYNLVVDLNGNGQINQGDEAVVVNGGGAIFNIGDDALGFAQQTPVRQLDSTFTTRGVNIEEGGDEITQIFIVEAPGNEVDMLFGTTIPGLQSVASGLGLSGDPQNPDQRRVRSRYGALYQTFDNGIDPSELNVEYPYSQVEVKAYAVYDGVASPICGDINGDGRVDIVDALLISKYSAGQLGLSLEQEPIADVNGDGRVDILDALLIARISAGIPVIGPSC